MRDQTSLRPLAAAVFAALLAACTVGPDHVRPDVDTGTAFVRATPAATADASATAAVAPRADAAFWEALGDPQLTALVERTLRANHDLRIALARRDAADALLRGAKADRFPTVTAGAAVSDGRASTDQLPAGADRDTRSADASIRLGWELDLFGRVRRSVEAGTADADATAADLHALQVSLVADVATQYVSLRGTQERLRVTREQAANQQATMRLVEDGLAAGRGTEFDVARVRAQYESTAARIPALEAQVAFAEHRLAVLTGLAPGALVAELDVPKPLPAAPPAPAPGTPGDLLRRRPDIAAAEERLHAATARVGVATADLFPRFTLGGLIGSQAGSAGDLFDGGGGTRLVALGIDWSFLDVGHVRARIAAADANAEGELARYEQTVLRALEDTENALVRFDKARRTDGHLATAALESDRAADLARVRVESGVGTLLDVLDAERTDLQAQDALAQSRTDTVAAWVGVYRSLAGGWPQQLPERRTLAQVDNGGSATRKPSP
jgi:NodT family efflux transporter outer membrane factor (OMF) lipoprotein